MSKKTLVIGASENPARYSNMAIKRLLQKGHEVKAIGARPGVVETVNIETGEPPISGIDTVTLYINPQRQADYVKYILSLQPKRIIFNPGTENDDFEAIAKEKGIQTLEACTLVMLGTGQY